MKGLTPKLSAFGWNGLGWQYGLSESRLAGGEDDLFGFAGGFEFDFDDKMAGSGMVDFGPVEGLLVRNVRQVYSKLDVAQRAFHINGTKDLELKFLGCWLGDLVGAS